MKSKFELGNSRYDVYAAFFFVSLLSHGKFHLAGGVRGKVVSQSTRAMSEIKTKLLSVVKLHESI